MAMRKQIFSGGAGLSNDEKEFAAALNASTERETSRDHNGHSCLRLCCVHDKKIPSLPLASVLSRFTAVW